MHARRQPLADYRFPQLWDLATNRVVSLDFAAELESVRRRSSRLCVASYDDARGVILVGADDGSVFVRRVTRIAGRCTSTPDVMWYGADVYVYTASEPHQHEPHPRLQVRTTSQLLWRDFQRHLLRPRLPAV